MTSVVFIWHITNTLKRYGHGANGATPFLPSATPIAVNDPQHITTHHPKNPATVRQHTDGMTPVSEPLSSSRGSKCRFAPRRHARHAISAAGAAACTATFTAT